nr:putative germin-like protein 2-3 [Quercus suber]
MAARVNGFACLDPKLAQADHFFPSGLDKAGNTSNPLGSSVTPVTKHTWYRTGSLGLCSMGSHSTTFSSSCYQVGLVHFQQNVGQGKAISISALSSQNPGIITVANAVFGSKPSIAVDILSKAFQVDKSVIDYLQAKF